MASRLICCLLVLLVLAFISGCASLHGDWSEAEFKNTTASYEEFLRNHPETEALQMQEEARKRIANPDYAFLATCRLNLIEGKEYLLKTNKTLFLGFLQSFPESVYATLVRDYVAFLNEVKGGIDIQTHKNFIAAHPDNPFIIEAISMFPILWLKETEARNIGVVIEIGPLIREGIIGVISSNPDKDEIVQKVWKDISAEIEKEGMTPVLLEGPESRTSAQVDAIVTVIHAESKVQRQNIGYQPTMADSMNQAAANMLADAIMGPPVDEVLSITVEKAGTTYYSNYPHGEGGRFWSVALNPYAFSAVGDEGKVSIFYLLRHESDPLKAEELLKQLKAKL